jgi:hypothetical protein
MMHSKIAVYSMLGIQSLSANVYMIWAYSFNCTFVRLICLQDVGKEREQERKLCLTAKILRRMTGFCSCKTSIPYVLYITMQDFLVGATEPDKRTLKRVITMDGVYLAFAGAKSYQLRIPR